MKKNISFTEVDKKDSNNRKYLDLSKEEVIEKVLGLPKVEELDKTWKMYKKRRLDVWR